MTRKSMIAGIAVDAMRADQWTDLLVEDWRKKKEGGAAQKVVPPSTGQVVSLSACDPAYARAVSRADHVAADGMSIVMASRVLGGVQLPERVATTDWFHDAALAAQQS